MRKFFMLFVVSFIFVLFGCSSSSVARPASSPPSPPNVIYMDRSGEVIPQGCKAVSSAGSWIYNTGKGGWEWVTSSEVQAKVKDGGLWVWDIIKDKL